MRTKHITASPLVAVTRFRVRFSELDPMDVVWHGNYAVYLEDGREAFGRAFPCLGYEDIRASGFGAPIVEMNVKFRRPLRLGDHAVVETRYIATEAAKICFEYEIRALDGPDGERGEVIATAATTQVFIGGNGELELVAPRFYVDWKRRWDVK